MPAADPCKADSCGNQVGSHGARGYCPFHYHRFKTTGDPFVSLTDIVRRERPCPQCGTSFSPRDKRSKICDECKRLAQIEYNREWRRRNPEYHSEYNKRWRQEHPEEYRAYWEWYRTTYPDKVKAAYQKWEAANPNHVREWTERNREQARETVRRRRSRLRSAQSFEVTTRDVKRMVARFGNRCAYCRERLSDRYHVDHVVPISRGGDNGIGNLVPACAACNSSKNNWLLSEWRYRDSLSKPLRKPVSTHVHDL